MNYFISKMLLPSIYNTSQENTLAYFYTNNRTPFSMNISKYTLPVDLKRLIKQNWKINTSRYCMFNFKGIELTFQDILFQKNGFVKVYVTFQGRELDSKFIYQEFDLIRLLGSGSTILARHKDTLQQVVIKRIQVEMANADQVDSIFKICALLKSTAHPNLIQIQNILILANMDIMIFKEYIQGQTLYEFFNKQTNGIDEYYVRNYLLQILQCLDYCQSTGIPFENLNLKNIILDSQQQIKILNFGHSKLQNKQIHLNYMAPEEFYQHDEYDFNSIGIWVVGIIAFALVYGRFPFDGEHELDNDQGYETETLIKQNQYSFAGKEVSVEFKDFILRIFQLEPSHRIQMHHLLVHPWLHQKELTFFNIEEPKFKIQQQMRKIYNQKKKTEIPKRFRSNTPQNSMRNKLKLYEYGREFRILSMQQ